jgi:rhodanese-related sulfurtransferase
LIRFLQALREAGALLIVAGALGLVYTGSTEKGLFAHLPPQAPTLPKGLAAPVMISREQAQALFESGNVVFIDARHEYDFKLGHIKGAVNIPLRMFEKMKDILDTIPKARTLVAYCDGAECNSSIELSVDLAKAGYADVKIFFGGWREWTSSHLPTAKTP